MLRKVLFSFTLLFLSVSSQVFGQQSVARQWNEMLLEAIRHDFARPTVHARNLFHTSVALYDSWAIYDDVAETYFLGKTIHGYTCAFNGISTPANVQDAQEETMSYAIYRLLIHRFENSPGAPESIDRFDSLFVEVLGYDSSFYGVDYSSGSAAALGNYLAQEIIAYGHQDGSNEQNAYANQFYTPANVPLIPTQPGNPDIMDLNRWQPLALDTFVDQSGNVFPINVPPFLSPEWGYVSPFALGLHDLTIKSRDGNDYWLYHDPGPPSYIDTVNGWGLSDDYKWFFALVSTWSSHLDPADGVMWDISPASIGNIPTLSADPNDWKTFYDLLDGGDASLGHATNPATGSPYTPQIVPRADYTRVLAEFWADGPDSETPPGHWFTILNYVNDHPMFTKQFRGTGPVLDDLEWDVKAYFTLAGAMHDAAVSAWGVKGYYDYLRPISALRAMADHGQCSDPGKPNYSAKGIPLITGYIEQVELGDPLAGGSNEHVGKIKLYAWNGPDSISDPMTDIAGVGWILAENWWPYQRPTFVTPPFAGYVSGHSTFSRAAAEVMTLLTGDEYFPGGMGEFVATQNDFLVFEDGPSMTITLQWATYRDASDQTSLSRIWGGIHPPTDDIPGRIMGIEIGLDAFDFAEAHFLGNPTSVDENNIDEGNILAYPNPVEKGLILTVKLEEAQKDLQITFVNIHGQVVKETSIIMNESQQSIELNTSGLAPGIYVVKLESDNWSKSVRVQVL